MVNKFRYLKVLSRTGPDAGGVKMLLAEWLKVALGRHFNLYLLNFGPLDSGGGRCGIRIWRSIVEREPPDNCLELTGCPAEVLEGLQLKCIDMKWIFRWSVSLGDNPAPPWPEADPVGRKWGTGYLASGVSRNC